MVIYKIPTIEGEIKVPSKLLNDVRVKSFYDEIKDVSNISLDYFYINLNTLKFEKITPKMNVDDKYKALYSAGRSILYLRDTYEDLSKDHELTHLTSTIRTKNCIYCGFSQTDGSTEIGVGLTEGYTVMQDLRYHGSKEKEEFYKNIYLLPREMANFVEILIGQDIMEPLFYKADLFSLIEVLSNYMPFKDVIAFINDIDIINYNTNIVESNMAYIRVAKAYERCIAFLTEAFLYKYEYTFQAGEITAEEYNEGLVFCKKISTRRISFPTFKVAKSRPISDNKFFKLLKKCQKESKKNI